MAVIYNVLDISKYNPIDNYSQAAAEIDGVLIRIGYRGYGSSGNIVKDNLFETHYAGFLNKTKLGVYFFTQAITAAEGIEEANWVYNIIKDRQIDMPVFIDTEYSNNNHNGRADNISAAQRTIAVCAFCDRMIELGYQSGIYASDAWYISNLDFNTIKTKTNYLIWVASYSSAPKRVTTYDAWQYTSAATLAGISGRVDMSYVYTDFAGWESTEKRDIANSTVSLDLNETMYYAGPNCPNPTVVYDNAVLTLNKHYTVSYEDNVNAGTGKVIITGKGIYTGTKVVEFLINRREFDLGIGIFIDPNPNEENCYDISTLTLKLTEEEILEENVDYTKTVTESTKDGYKVANIEIVGIGNYTGTLNLQYNIEKIRISISSFTVDITETFVYTGNPLTPGIVLTDQEGNTLSSVTDYELSYKNNTVVGTATVTISGKGNYKDTKESHFRIVPKNITECTISCGNSDDNGCYSINNFKIQYGSITLVKDIDYEMIAESNTVENRVTTTVVAEGKGNYTGTITESYLTEIIDTRIDIATLSFSLSQDSFSYNPNIPHRPEITIPEELTEEDYRISYTDNVNAGTGKAIITAKGETYKGEKILEFTITSISIADCTVSCGIPDSFGFYDPDQLTVKYTGVFNQDLVKDTDYTLIKEIEEDDDFYYAKFTIQGIGNYDNSITVRYRTGEIPPRPKTMEELDIEFIPTIYDYNGTARIPTVTVFDEEEGYELIPDTDYTIEFTDNINAGTAHITITGITDIYNGMVVLDYIINQINISTGSLSCGAVDENGYYDLNNITVSVNYRILREEVDYSVEIQSKESGKFVVAEVTVTGINNYYGSITREFRTDKLVKNINDAEFIVDTTFFSYTGEEQRPTITTELEESVDYSISYPEESINSGTYQITITGLDIYVGTKIIEYTIGALDLNDSSITVTFDEPDSLGCVSIQSMKVMRGETELIPYYDYSISIDSIELEEGFIQSTITLTGLRNYTGTREVKILSSKKEYYSGRKVILDNIKVYIRYSSKKHSIRKSGTYYLWDDNVINNRVRVTNNSNYVGLPGYITGWIDLEDLIDKNSIRLKDTVMVTGNLNTMADGKGNNISRNGVTMVVVDILDKEEFEYPYGLASDINRARIGWARETDIKKLNIEEEE